MDTHRNPYRKGAWKGVCGLEQFHSDSSVASSWTFAFCSLPGMPRIHGRICDRCGQPYLGRGRCSDASCPRNTTSRRQLFSRDGHPRFAVDGRRVATVPVPPRAPGPVAVAPSSIRQVTAPAAVLVPPAHVVQQTRVSAFQSPAQSDPSSVTAVLEHCTICMEAFVGGDHVRTLPCMHRYHVRCVDWWLAAHTECPIYRRHLG